MYYVLPKAFSVGSSFSIKQFRYFSGPRFLESIIILFLICDLIYLERKTCLYLLLKPCHSVVVAQCHGSVVSLSHNVSVIIIWCYCRSATVAAVR